MNHEPFALAPEQLLALAANYRSGLPIDLLHERIDVGFDARGLCSRRVWRTYTVREERFLGAGGSVRAQWSPWFMNQPDLQARVVGPDGSESWLEPSALFVRDVEQDTPTLFGDDKSLAGPLPRLVVGAVVETVTAHGEHRLPLSCGSAIEFVAPISRRFEVHVRAPRSLPLVWTADGGEPPQAVEDGTMRQWFIRVDEQPEPVGFELSPCDIRALPTFAVGAASSWTQVGQTYAAVVDSILDAPPQAWVDELAALPDTRARARAAFAMCRERIRYTGLEVGQGSIVPRPPSEVCATGFGDCKDKATLMVALLRAVGVRAAVAMVRAGGTDPLEGAPGFGVFNHAIAWVDGEGFFDPTAPVPYPALPRGLQGRYAVIADSEHGWTHIEPVANTHRYMKELVRIETTDRGEATVVERTESAGWVAHDLWPRSARPDPRDFLDYMRGAYGAKRVEAVEVEHPSRGVDPLVLTIRATKLNHADADVLEGWAWVPLVPHLFRYLPLHLWFELDERRTVPFAVPPHRVESRFEVVMPPGHIPTFLPEPLEARFGPVEIEVRAEPMAGGVCVHARVDVGDGRIEPADARALARWVNAAPLTPRLGFESASVTACEQGQLAASVHIAQQVAERGTVTARAGLAMALARVGLRDLALKALPPGAPADEALRQLWTGRVLQHDALGREDAPGADVDGALAALRRAAELGEEDAEQTLAYTIQSSPLGVRHGPGAPLDEAVPLLEHLLDEKGLRCALDLARCLLLLDRPRDAIARIDAELSEPREEPVYLAAVARVHGAEAARNLIPDALPAAAQANLLVGAIGLLERLRAWDRCRELGQVLERVAPSAGRSFRLRHAGVEAHETREDRLQTAVAAALQAAFADPEDHATGDALRQVGRELEIELVIDLVLGALHTERRGDLAFVATMPHCLLSLGLVFARVDDAWRLAAATPQQMFAEALAAFERSDGLGAHWTRWAVATLEGGHLPTADAEGEDDLAAIAIHSLERREQPPSTLQGVLWQALGPSGELVSLARLMCVEDMVLPPAGLDALHAGEWHRLGAEHWEQLGRLDLALAHAARLTQSPRDTLRHARVAAAAGAEAEALEQLRALWQGACDADSLAASLPVAAGAGATRDEILAVARRCVRDMPSNEELPHVVWHLLFGGEEEQQAAVAIAAWAAERGASHALPIATALAWAGGLAQALDAMRLASPFGDALGPDYELVRGLMCLHYGLDDHVRRFGALAEGPYGPASLAAHLVG